MKSKDTPKPNPQRDSIFVEKNAKIIGHDSFPGEQYILRVVAPQIAAKARPGQFAHITCDPALPLPRPISIMRVNRESGWVEFLYKILGHGTRLLSRRKVGESLQLMGPIGNQFTIDKDRPRRLLIGGGVGIPPMLFFADCLRQNTFSEKQEKKPEQDQREARSLVIMGSEVPFPFQTRKSQRQIPGVPEAVNAVHSLLEEWEIDSRLTSLQRYPGCYTGYVTDLARHWLDSIGAEATRRVAVYSCGPHAMLQAVAKLARDYSLPCQVSVEESMACAVGGCAGCVVKVNTDEGSVMKRVCVDGPVFDAQQVFY